MLTRLYELFFMSSTGLAPITAKEAPSLTVASNYSNVTSFLRHVVNRAAIKFEAGAYVHWYEKYGCEKVSGGITAWICQFHNVI